MGDDPVIEYVQDVTHFYNLDPDYEQKIDMFFRNSEVVINDLAWDMFEMYDYPSWMFYEFSETMRHTKRIPASKPYDEREYLNIFFRADQLRQIYKRDDYELLTYLGDLGGLLDFIVLLGWLISAVFVRRLFQAALVEKAYRLQ